MAGNAGRGYVNGNDSPTGSNYTVIDLFTPCDGDGWVTAIQVSLASNGGTLEIGCGNLSGTTFYPRTYVTIDTSGDGTGQKTYNAPADFTSFRILEDDHIFFYTNTGAGACELTKTNTTPAGIRYIVGNSMGDVSFETSLYAAADAEMSCTGQAGNPLYVIPGGCALLGVG